MPSSVLGKTAVRYSWDAGSVPNSRGKHTSAGDTVPGYPGECPDPAPIQIAYEPLWVSRTTSSSKCRKVFQGEAIHHFINPVALGFVEAGLNKENGPSGF